MTVCFMRKQWTLRTTVVDSIGKGLLLLNKLRRRPLKKLMRKKNSLEVCLLVLLAIGWGQRTEPAQAADLAEAYAGEPYGVGRVTIGVLRGEPVLPLSDERFTLAEAAGRAMYPVLKEELGRRLLRQALQIEAPRQVTFYFLFRGDQPFDLSVYTPHEQGVRVKPQQDEAGHTRLMEAWWKQMTDRLARLQTDPTYPPLAENFLTASLARRLGLEIPEPKPRWLPWNQKKETALSDLFLTESFQLSLDQETLAGAMAVGELPKPLPEPRQWKPPKFSEPNLEEVPVELIAQYVPAECFYLRFGNFSNYFWFRELNQKWQGDLGNMILRRGILKGSGQRIEQQLSLRENALAKILGPQVIADAAIIGFDPYVAQGAAIGILFQAKNNFLLSQDLIKQRREALKKFPDATEQTVQMLDQDVSLVATADGRVRSFYVQQEDFHLVTTSATLAQRFIAAAGGDRPLAELPTFLQARRQLPLDRDDTVFAYVSEEFFQNLCSPAYRIETLRRLRSFRERHLLELARFAAKVEGIEAFTAQELMESDLLPVSMGLRTDESQLLEGEAGFVDTLRGAPGFFLPVADVFTPFASSIEAAEYQKFAQKYQEQIGQMPPIAVGVQRAQHEKNAGETIRVDIWAAQLESSKLGATFDSLGEPARERLRPIAGDILFAEASLDLPVPLLGGETMPHHIFGALRDFCSPLVVQSGALRPAAAPAELVRGYVGAWPKPGLLEMLVGSTPPAGREVQQAGDQLWQAQQEDFLLISFKPDVIEQVLPQLTLEPANRPAQLRLRLEDLTGTQMAHNVNALGYMRSRDTSVTASRLMNSLANQLQVPRPECRALAERLVDGQFVCALGGEYQLYAPERGLEVWISSALPEQNHFLLTEVPADFTLPLLSWFRGLAGDLQVTDESLRAHLEIEMTAAALP